LEAHNLLEQLLQQLPTFPPAVVYAIIGILASTENVFPPIPADTAVALGAFLSNVSTISAWAVFGVTWAANVGSATGVYVAARTVGRTFFTGRLGRRLVKPEAMERIEHLYERHGTWGIFLSRFIPGVRAVIPPFAGVADLKSVRALVPMILASGIWYGTLTFVAANLVPKLDDVANLVTRMNWVGLVAFVVIAAVAGVALLMRSRRRKSIDPKGPTS
jgi:membrane protein DedA with SNARE-associated domain